MLNKVHNVHYKPKGETHSNLYSLIVKRRIERARIITATLKVAQPGRSKMLLAGWGQEHEAFCLLKRRFVMRSPIGLTREQIRERLFSPLSREAKKQFHEIDQQHKWLLDLNLKEMEKDTNTSDQNDTKPAIEDNDENKNLG